MHQEYTRYIDTSSQPKTPEDYRRAIATLKASTFAIESHTTTTQQILDTLIAKQDSKSRPTTNNKHQALSAQISSQHTYLTQYLATTSSDLQKAVSSTLITLDDTLSRDDYTFDQIARNLAAVNLRGQRSEHNGTDVGDDKDNENDDTTRSSKLLDALHRTETEVIRTRLQRIYLDTLDSASYSSNSNGTYSIDGDYDHADPTKLSSIHSDLRTLYTEIEDVASLFIAHEHGDNLNQLNDEISRANRVLAQQRGEWAVGKLREMRGRLIGIEEAVRGVQGQRVVVGRLGTLLGAVDGMTGGKVDVGGEGMVDMRKKEGDSPALVGLRGYLGVGADSAIGQRERVEQSFKEVRGGVERVLEVQSSQAVMLKGSPKSLISLSDQHNPANDGGNSEISRDVYTALLDELDGEIATVKEGIEKLPSG